MRHIIIEGPDGAGKTTLARRLCAQYSMGYWHEGPPPSGADLLHHYASLLVRATRPTVFDRFHLGELVYGPILRAGSGLAPADVALLNRVIHGWGIHLVVCKPAWETCWSNNQRKPELIQDEKRMRAAYDGWSLVLHNPALFPRPPKLYGYQFSSRPFAVVPLPRCPAGVIGSPNARFLFVGEQANNRSGRALDLAFFGHSRSSGYLNERLVEAGIGEDDLALTNAIGLDGQVRDLPFIVSQMPFLERVVALGGVAERQFDRQGLPPFVATRLVHHPSFWKRFHAHEPEIYVNLLKEACGV